jgi:hypothetical protein
MDRSARRQTPVERYERKPIFMLSNNRRKAVPFFLLNPYLPLHLAIASPCSDAIANRLVVALVDKSGGRRFTESGQVFSHGGDAGAGRIWPVGVLGAAAAGSSVIVSFNSRVIFSLTRCTVRVSHKLHNKVTLILLNPSRKL